MESGTSPVSVETEVLPAQTVEKDARGRLGRILAENGRPILSSVAVRLPQHLRGLEGTSLVTAIRENATFGYAVFTGKRPDDAERWPHSGWVSGNIADLCLVCQSMTIPPAIIEQASERLVQGVGHAAGLLSEFAKTHPKALQDIAETLKQEDDLQTRRMAMTMIANAFIFHASIAGLGGALQSVRSVHQIRSNLGHLAGAEVIAEWEKILKINYWPIFDIAMRIAVLLPAQIAVQILTELADTAGLVLESGLMHSHDLVGAIFQKLIIDRKFLAAYYTRPASAALLAGLALSRTVTPRNTSWADPENVCALRIADFACGTGTLLSTVYHSIRQIHEFYGGDEASLHPRMMSDALLGADIMPAATHITASMLSGAHPSITYTSGSILLMPYSKQDDASISLGSLDLLKTQGTFPILATRATAISGAGTKAQDMWRTIPDRHFDLVIMNPPFVRATNHEGKKGNVPNPMFAAFGSTKEEQKAMSKQMKIVAAKTAYHGNAGEASAFLALGNQKLADGGQLALVMPLSLQVGEGWSKSRTLLRKNYQDLCVVNIAAAKDSEASFSADTDMAECLILGRRTGQASKRALFAILAAPPATPLEGAAVARDIREKWASGNIRTLEDGPVGGTEIRVGNDVLGVLIEGPLTGSGPWPISRVGDASIAQAAYQLVSGNRLWLPGMPEKDAVAMPMCPLKTLADVGTLHRDINGVERGIYRGPFDIVKIVAGQVPTHPALWNHKASAERCILVPPDTQGVARQPQKPEQVETLKTKLANVRKTASRCHFNYDFRYNSQSTAACYTAQRSIGGRAWPSVIFHTTEHEKAFLLWANSTLGLLCHWWQASKQHTGRGSITLTALPRFVIHDFRHLTKNQLKTAASKFDDFLERPLRPFNEIDKDTNRHELDRTVLVDILGFDKSFVDEDGAIPLLRRKLAQEPSIRGSKGTAKKSKGKAPTLSETSPIA
jgi:hypothetical protein